MKNLASPRKFIAAAVIGLSAIVGGSLSAGAASASTSGITVLMNPDHDVVQSVTVMDWTHLSTNPAVIYSGDAINVCANIKNVGPGMAVPAKTVSFTGPNYHVDNLFGTLAGGSSDSVCTGYYALHFTPLASGNCYPIQISATVDGSTMASRSFYQAPCNADPLH